MPQQSSSVEVTSMTGREVILTDDNTATTSTTEEIMDEDDEVLESRSQAFSTTASVLEMELEENEDKEFEKSAVNLSWRLDPEESLSDWTILVKTKRSNDDKVDTYHVHKSVLGVGPRRSNYFATAIRRVEEQGDKNRFMQQQQQKLKTKQKANTSFGGGGSDMLFLGEFLQESCDFVLAGATPLLDYVGNEHRFKCGDKNATMLELEEPAVKAFPALLDYAYGHHTKSQYTMKLRINTQSATALHHLGDKLEMKLLRKDAREFWKTDLNLDNMLTYYKDARLMGDELIAKYAAGCLSVSILELEEKQVVHYLKHVDADFMMQVLHFLAESQAAKVQKLALVDGIQSNIANSKRLSLIVAIYCNLHRQDPMSLNTLERLTDAKNIPELDVKAAQVLLEIENETSKDYSTLTSLKRRCIAVLSQSWDHLKLEAQNNADDSPNGSLDADSKAQVTIPRLEGPALAHFVVRSLTRAKQQLDGMEAIRNEWQDLKTQVSVLNNQVDELMREKEREGQHQEHEETEEEGEAEEAGPNPVTPMGPKKADDKIMFF